MLTLVLAATLVVEIPLYANVELPPEALSRALAEADRLFDSTGVRFAWRVSPAATETATSALAAIVLTARPERPVISGCTRNLHDHRLGRAELGARRVTLWTEQVARAVAGSWDRRDTPRVDRNALGTALGRVLAHELGHLFLRLDGHRESGLMKPSFSQRALVRSSDHSFRLSEKDLERVREAITHLQVSLAREP
ncbi:MAG TPA: hypothetical protein VJ921_11980 [Vicinamibacteria bacterium]|nr:hypothetical protein [Vicinamibacteria bacterium]